MSVLEVMIKLGASGPTLLLKVAVPVQRITQKYASWLWKQRAKLNLILTENLGGRPST